MSRRKRQGKRVTDRKVSGSNKRERVQLTFCDMSEQYNNNCSRQPKSNTLGRVLRGRVAGAGHGHGKHVGLLAHDTLWSANEPKTAGRNCEPRRCPQLPLAFCPLFLSLSLQCSLSVSIFLVIVVSILGWTFVYVKF